MNLLYQFIEKFNFATLISYNNGEPNVSHVPVMLDRKKGAHGTLAWHVAKHNPHSTEFDGSKDALCIFHGPHAYVSPGWYNSSPNVPTWNYAVVHVYGKPLQVSNEKLEKDLAQMVMLYEGNSDYTIPDSYKQKMMGHIVGFEMEISRIESRFKLGLSRSQEDQNGVLSGLQKQDNNAGLALVEFMQSMLIKT